LNHTDKPMQAIPITRYSIVNSIGVGRSRVFESLHARRSGLQRCDFDTCDLDTYIGRVRSLDKIKVRGDLHMYDCRNNRLAQLALETDGFADAVRTARERYGAARIGVFMGTSTSGLLQAELAYRERDPATGVLPKAFEYAPTQNNFSLAAFVQAYLDLAGPAVTVSSACSSSAKVFGNAARMMAAGLCDAAVVGGVDTLCLTTLYGFNSLQLLSCTPCRAFDAQRDGISIGEGAGFALLEKTGEAGDPMLLGVGESSDAHHMSTPHPAGLGAALAMRRALAAADLSASDIDYINLHGTASKTNDAAEDKAVSQVFGLSTPVSSTKGYTGHLLGAAGITEAIIALLAIKHQVLPGGLHTQTLDPTLTSHYLLNNMTARVKRVLSNSFGFGGSNCSLVLGVRG
jgi:3-oxoacyl-[acyl-carrier-protein] synthase I